MKTIMYHTWRHYQDHHYHRGVGRKCVYNAFKLFYVFLIRSTFSALRLHSNYSWSKQQLCVQPYELFRWRREIQRRRRGPLRSCPQQDQPLHWCLRQVQLRRQVRSGRCLRGVPRRATRKSPGTRVRTARREPLLGSLDGSPRVHD